MSEVKSGYNKESRKGAEDAKNLNSAISYKPLVRSLREKYCFIILLSLLLFSGCDGVRGKLLVMEGNMQVSKMQTSQSPHNEAISSYSEALRYPEALPYAEYGLGLVYLFLGEDAAAFTRFDNAAAAADSELIQNDDELNYRLHYNRGILHFHASQFDEAAAAFRNALEIDASRIEAKRNLELSLLSMEQQNAAASSSPVEVKSDQSKDNTLFDYLRQKEVDTWTAPESSEDQDSPWLDY
jgi:Ca-activated chloride channel family protein